MLFVLQGGGLTLKFTWLRAMLIIKTYTTACKVLLHKSWLTSTPSSLYALFSLFKCQLLLHSVASLRSSAALTLKTYTTTYTMACKPSSCKSWLTPPPLFPTTSTSSSVFSTVNSSSTLTTLLPSFCHCLHSVPYIQLHLRSVPLSRALSSLKPYRKRTLTILSNEQVASLN